MMVLTAETRSFQRAAIVMQRVVGLSASPTTIERVAMEVGNDLEAAEQNHWKDQLRGEVPVPSLAVIEFDGGRIRTRKTGCGPGVHLENQGWNETQNAIFVSAARETSAEDPQKEPPRCFLDRHPVAKLTEQAKMREKPGSDDGIGDPSSDPEAQEAPASGSHHRPQRILRTVVSSMKNSRQFAWQMKREAERRRFDHASRKAFVADGLTCNWTIHAEHFGDYVAILDFVHAVSHLFTASVAVFGKTEQAWQAYVDWMRATWQGRVEDVLEQLRAHQDQLGQPEEGIPEDDPRERLRRVIGYLENNRSRMRYAEYRRQGLPTTSAWMESVIKEMNYRIKGSEMFWNNPAGAEAILQIRAAALCDDDRLLRLLTRRPGKSTVRPGKTLSHAV